MRNADLCVSFVAVSISCITCLFVVSTHDVRVIGLPAVIHAMYQCSQ